MNCNDSEWESICRRCGLCCFEKIETESGAVFYTQVPCRFLDVVSRECTIYDRRFEISRDCVKLTPELVPQLHWLHPDCGYRLHRERDGGRDAPAKRKARRR